VLADAVFGRVLANVVFGQQLLNERGEFRVARRFIFRGSVNGTPRKSPINSSALC